MHELPKDQNLDRAKYEPPRLMPYGSVRDITKNQGSNGLRDGIGAIHNSSP